MRPSVWLRIAAIIALVYFAGHTAGIPWTPVRDPGENAVIEAMKSRRFDVAGFQRSYWDFYYGFGLAIAAFLLVQAVVLWQLAGVARADPARVRPIVLSFCIAFAVNAFLAWTYFFPIPSILAGAVALCLGAAFVAAGRDVA